MICKRCKGYGEVFAPFDADYQFDPCPECTESEPRTMPNPSSHEWLVWLHLPTGRVAYYFPDEDAARVFAIKNSTLPVHKPIDH